MTYKSLATRALFATRSQLNPVLETVGNVALRLGYVACLLALGGAVGIQVGANQADQRHAESLRRIIPVAEAALEALEEEAEALADTIEAIEGVQR